MRRSGLLIGCGAAVVVLAGIVQAQTLPPLTPPASATLSADPIADALKAQTTVPAREEAPPAPGEVTPPPVTERPAVATPEPSRAGDAAGAVDGVATPPIDAALASRRVRHQAAIIQAIDKITSEKLKFEARVGQPVRYKGLVFNVRACETSAADEPMADSVAYLEVRSEPRTQSEQAASRRVFRGWMYARSPSLNPLQHNVYDAWLISCRDPRPDSVGGVR